MKDIATKNVLIIPKLASFTLIDLIPNLPVFTASRRGALAWLILLSR